MKTLGLEEAAAFLHMSAYCLRQMAEAGKVPGAKTGPKGYRWVFTDEALEEYLRDEIRRQTATRRGEPLEQNESIMKTQAARRRKSAPPPTLC